MRETEKQEVKHVNFSASMHPDMLKRAEQRARSLGLTRSRYVALCVEAELGGKFSAIGGEASGEPAEPASIDIGQAMERGGRYGEVKARSIEFEGDVEELLKAEGASFSRAAKVDSQRTDFLVDYKPPRARKVRKVAIECRYNMRNRYEVTLGQLLLLKNTPGVNGVVLVVPYLTHFDPAIRETFQANGIPVATPDTLMGALNG